MIASVLLAVLRLWTGPAAQADTCAPSILLPAYSHNDYRNRRPLLDALALGYRGAEVDLFRVGAELVVAHERRGLRRQRTLARLYLDPLQARQRTCGYVLADSTPFFLNIELKEADPEAFRLLLAELRAREGLFVSPVPGSAPFVQVTLVGWWPTPESPASSWPHYIRIQLAAEHAGAVPARHNGSPVGLVSVDYGKALKWRGRGTVPRTGQELLAQARDLAAVFAVPVRVHHAPPDIEIYRWLLSQGVSLIGAHDLTSTHELLQQLSGSRLTRP